MQRAVLSSSSSSSLSTPPSLVPLPAAKVQPPATLRLPAAAAANPLDGLDDQAYAALLASMPDSALPTYGVLYPMHQMLSNPLRFGAALRHVAATYSESTLRDFLTTLQAGLDGRGAWRYIYARLLYELVQDRPAVLEELLRSAATPLSAYLASAFFDRGRAAYALRHGDAAPLPPYVLPANKLELRGGTRDQPMYAVCATAERFSHTLQYSACKALVQTAFDDVVAYAGTRLSAAVVASLAHVHGAAVGFYVLAEYAAALERGGDEPCFGDRLALRSGTEYNSLAAFVERKRASKVAIKASGAEAAPILTAYLPELLARLSPPLQQDKLYGRLRDLSRRYSNAYFIVAGTADEVDEWINGIERPLIKRRGPRLADALRRMLLYNYPTVHDDALRALPGVFSV